LGGGEGKEEKKGREVGEHHHGVLMLGLELEGSAVD
jgi:hypothetical protein